MKLKPIVALIISMILIINIGISFAESTNSWDCNVCGNKNNTGNFCPNCAAAKPNDEAWTCDVCQQTGNTGNYCTNCAAAKPSGEAWTCNVCQQSGNTGNYCVNCGSSRILKLPAVVNYSVGSKVYFGNYPQRLNNPEPILWKILDIKGNKALLMSAYGLDSVQYHPVATNITWEHCFLRSWLNNNFLNAAFSNEERTAILKTLVLNEENIFYPNTPAGANTEDYVFILSVKEALRYLPSRTDRLIQATEYAFSKGAYRNKNGDDFSWWWLRSPGKKSNTAARIRGADDDNKDRRAGDILYNEVDDHEDVVIPCIWVDLSMLDSLSFK